MCKATDYNSPFLHFRHTQPDDGYFTQPKSVAAITDATIKLCIDELYLPTSCAPFFFVFHYALMCINSQSVGKLALVRCRT